MIAECRAGVVIAALCLAIAEQARACECLARYSVCGEVAASDLVFVGTVESLEPAFLDPWDPNREVHLHYNELSKLMAENSPASMDRLRSLFTEIFPHMPEYYQRVLKTAQTPAQMQQIFGSLSGEGRQARIRVRTLFQHKSDDDDKKDSASKKDDNNDRQQRAGKKKDDDDDDRGNPAAKDKKDDDDLTGKVIEVWTEASDCGVPFQVGETYLIYADDDEETGTISTSTCTRTARLSDAGADLAYLYYFINGGDRSSRLEGFVTSDARARFAAEAQRDAGSIPSPVGGAAIQLRSSEPSRYTYSDPAGRFIFDGLPAGDYTLSAFAAGYPRTVKELGFPQSFHIAAKSCAREILTAPEETSSPR